MCCLNLLSLYTLGGKPILLLSTMDSQLEAVKHDIRDVKWKIAKTEQNLAEHAHNAERDKVFLDLLLSLNNQLLSLNNQLLNLQEEKNILLRNQAPSKSLPSACTYWLTRIHIICAPFIE